MKRLIPTFFAISLALNVIAGLILSCYPTFNTVLNSVVLSVAIIFAIWSGRKTLASAFSISLAFIIPVLTIIEFVIGLIAPARYQDNWGILVILCLMAFQGFLIYAVTKRSRNNSSIQQ